MTIRSDPENNEIRALLKLTDFSGKHVLEIGCGDGRLTRRFADATAQVTAIDPFEESIRRAKAIQPAASRDQVEFHQIEFENFAADCESGQYDIVIFSWSL
jgi:2-polyprenyl-3-methyl-5-hydroxy-6-metoxy-1,4-benzoquinol methylase